MRITPRTKTKFLLPLLTDEERANKLLDAVTALPLDKPIVEMSIGEFITAIQPDYALQFLKEKRALKAFGHLKTYRDEMERVSKLMKSFETPKTSEQREAGVGIDFPTSEEQMLLDAVDAFHLHSFAEAEKVPLADFLLVKKSQSADIKYQHRYQRILERKNR